MCDKITKVEDAFDHALSEEMALGHGYQAAAKRAYEAALKAAKEQGIPCPISPEEAADMARLAELCDIGDEDGWDEEDGPGEIYGELNYEDWGL